MRDAPQVASAAAKEELRSAMCKQLIREAATRHSGVAVMSVLRSFSPFFFPGSPTSCQRSHKNVPRQA